VQAVEVGAAKGWATLEMEEVVSEVERVPVSMEEVAGVVMALEKAGAYLDWEAAMVAARMVEVVRVVVTM